jgi:ABC-2 type transport system permease protein
MKAFIHHLAYDFKTGIRDKSKLLMNYLFPLVFFALVGGFMTAVNPFFKETMLPAMLLFAYMSSALLTLPSIFLEARESGIFRSYRINGVPSVSIISIPVIGTAVHMAVVSVIMSLAGIALFGGKAPTNVAGYAAAAVLAYLTMSGLGVLIGIAANNTNISTLLAQLVYIPSIILGGLMVPASVFPSGFRRISLLFPATHAMRVFADLGNGQVSEGFWISIAVLGVSILLDFALAALLFQWDSRKSNPSRKAYIALLAATPFLIATVAG